MISKLMKYDFKWINKILLVYYLVLFILTIIVKAVESVEQSFLLLILDKIVSGLYISCICGLAITCLMRIWDRFSRKFYKDESYLTHTLPVTKNQLFNAIVLTGIISLIIATIVIIASILFTYISKDTIDSIKIMFQSLFDMYGKTTGIFFIISFVLIIFLETIYFMMSGIFGIVIGYRSNNYKLLKSIIVGLTSYGVLSTVSVVIIWIISKIANFEIASQTLPEPRYAKVLLITSILIYLVYNLMLYFISKYILNKGVNVD